MIRLNYIDINFSLAPMESIKLVHCGDMISDTIADHTACGAGGASTPAFASSTPSVFGASSASTFGEAQALAA